MNKIKSSDPHSIIIEISNILSNYQNTRKKNSFSDELTTAADLKEDLSLNRKFKLNLNLKSSLLSKSKSLLTNVFNLNSSTTLSEFTETPNNLHPHDDALTSMRLKFFHIPNYLNQKLWLACRSSGAAPTFFRASGPFIDGGIISNSAIQC